MKPADPGITASVCIAVFNEGPKAERLLDQLLKQTRLPEQVVIVDDCSTDDTFQRLCAARDRYHGPVEVLVLRQEKNGGPAVARNRAWKASRGSVCVFTDGDCQPRANWLERLLAPLAKDPERLAAGGTYADPEEGTLLARFIGHEIGWRYSRMPSEIDCHGSYNLAIRRATLESLGGFNERYPKPSGEDFDLTYRVAALKPLALVRDAQVGHDHPESFWPYMHNQARRGFDRVRLYLDHPSKANADSYTDAWVKYEILAAAMLVYSLPFVGLVPELIGLQLLLVIFLGASAKRPALYLLRRGGPVLSLYGFAVRFFRVFAWLWGLHQGAAHLLRRKLA